MDNLQTHYFEKGGFVLAVLARDNLIGSGAIRGLDDKTAELKRIWLLVAYQGWVFGFQLIKRLIDFAHLRGYRWS